MDQGNTPDTSTKSSSEVTLAPSAVADGVARHGKSALELYDFWSCIVAEVLLGGTHLESADTVRSGVERERTEQKQFQYPSAAYLFRDMPSSIKGTVWGRPSQGFWGRHPITGAPKLTTIVLQFWKGIPLPLHLYAAPAQRRMTAHSMPAGALILHDATVMTISPPSDDPGVWLGRGALGFYSLAKEYRRRQPHHCGSLCLGDIEGLSQEHLCVRVDRGIDGKRCGYRVGQRSRHPYQDRRLRSVLDIRSNVGGQWHNVPAARAGQDASPC
ncbi:hypothetical protein CALCODRAFT_545214 [Calocera cornea HHB12733]|uniref:Uncharacterized protein n=1 Tax=Calocera cornea HHB12733 TaxID=1353952 RepID=A0A165EXR3_9BASI|nr:hypothetical protein CALCODRAFT_545214 [Calocera cornea HHB12733]